MLCICPFALSYHDLKLVGINVPNVNRAISLLRQAANVLAQNSENSSAIVSDQAKEFETEVENTSDNNLIAGTSKVDNPPSQSEAMRNFRNLFAPYRQSNRATFNLLLPKRPCW